MIRTMLFSAALAAAGFAGPPALAQSASDKVALIRAIAANGCRVTAANNAAVLQAAGISEDAAARVVDALISSGEAAQEGGALVLKTGGC